MNQTPPNAVAIAEPNPREKLLGLLAGMNDGLIASFEHDGVTVHRFADSIQVSPEGPPEEAKGGRCLLDDRNLTELAKWVEAKADYYGD